MATLLPHVMTQCQQKTLFRAPHPLLLSPPSCHQNCPHPQSVQLNSVGRTNRLKPSPNTTPQESTCGWYPAALIIIASSSAGEISSHPSSGHTYILSLCGSEQLCTLTIRRGEVTAALSHIFLSPGVRGQDLHNSEPSCSQWISI